jgi:hypothetical protein
MERCGIQWGFLRDGSLLIAGEREGLTYDFASGFGTYNLVIPDPVVRVDIQLLVEDLVYILNVVSSVSVDTVTLQRMQELIIGAHCKCIGVLGAWFYCNRAVLPNLLIRICVSCFPFIHGLVHCSFRARLQRLCCGVL